MERIPPNPTYVEIAPPPSLGDLVASLWEMRIPSIAHARVRILPNACVDIVLYASDTSHGEGTAAVVAPPYRGFVVGSTLRSFIVRSIGWRHIVGASLLPAGVQPLLGLPARVVGESIAPLADILGAGAARFEERVLDGSAERCLDRLGSALLDLRASREASPLIAHAVNAVRATGGLVRMDALANDTNVSRRKLERQFLEHVGLSPKTFSRLVRFDQAVRGIATRGTRTWSDFALTLGYSDQAHFINEFKEFAGVTPTQYERELTRGLAGDSETAP